MGDGAGEHDVEGPERFVREPAVGPSLGTQRLERGAERRSMARLVDPEYPLYAGDARVTDHA